MRRFNPLPEWLSNDDLSELWQRDALAHVGAFLDAVEQELAAPKRGFPYSGFDCLGTKLSPALRERAEALFFRVWEASGTGKQRALAALLCLIGFTADGVDPLLEAGGSPLPCGRQDRGRAAGA